MSNKKKVQNQQKNEFAIVLSHLFPNFCHILKARGVINLERELSTDFDR